MQFPYTYLAVLLIFTLLMGVVIGDQLAANANGYDDRRSGGCAGLASARLHACVHRLGSVHTTSRKPPQVGPPGCPDCWSRSQRQGDTACEVEDDNGRDND